MTALAPSPAEVHYLMDLVAGVGRLVVGVILLAIAGRVLLLFLDLILNGDADSPRRPKGD